MMKQFIAGLIVLVSAWFPVVVFAAGPATMSFAQNTVTVSAGEMVDLTVIVSPNGEVLDTVRAIISFDPTVLTAQSVSLTGPFNRNTPGNFFDNEGGKISWGGFTLEGGVKTTGSFAKMTFLAQKNGTTTVAISPESRLISNGQEMIDTTKLGSVNVTVQVEVASDPAVSLLTLNSSSHPDEIAWFQNRTVDVDWKALDGDSAVTTYYYAFDESSSTDPKTVLPVTKTNFTFKDVKDGVHYFHLKGVQKNGKSTKTIHRRFNIDDTDPNGFELSINDDQLIEGESLWLTFATTDELSGVLQYQVAINASEFQVQTSPLELTDLKEGTYFIRAAAFDRAGNSVFQGKSVRVYKSGTDIGRPENYSPNSEITAILPFTNPSSLTPKPFPQKLLITLVLVVLAGFGIIYTIKRKKIK